VVGVIGTFNSPCAAIEIPITNRVQLAMLSPANSLVGLTQKGATSSAGEPDKYYPTRKRNYARVIPADNFQGAADAQYVKSLGVKSVYVLDDKEPYGQGIAKNFAGAARKLGIKVLGIESWDPTAGATYQSLFQQIGAKKPELIFLGGLTDSNGGQLIKDKDSVLGPNNGNVKLMGSDGLAQTSTITQSGTSNAEGMYMSASTLPVGTLKGPGKAFVEGFAKSEHLSVDRLQPYAVYGAQAAEVMVDAIKRSDGTRPSVLAAMFKTNLSNAILGKVQFNQFGDTTQAKVTVYRAVGGQLKVIKQITPDPALAKAAA